MRSDGSDFRDFIAPRLDSLRRVAYVLARDWHRADDLVSDTILKVLRSWPRIDALENSDAYVHRILINTWLDERRRFRRWREWPSDALPEVVRTDHQSAAD